MYTQQCGRTTNEHIHSRISYTSKVCNNKNSCKIINERERERERRLSKHKKKPLDPKWNA